MAATPDFCEIGKEGFDGQSHHHQSPSKNRSIECNYCKSMA
jgi:hypothetical protein